PAQFLPLIADDYVQVNLGRMYGPFDSWSKLAGDVLYRSRATSILLTYWTEQLAGFSPAAFNLSSLTLHLVNVALVALLGVWRVLGWRLSCSAALVFACAEGHQEAVIWYAALPELLVFTFVLAAFLFWILWLQEPNHRIRNYLLCLGCFILGVLSKESAVCLVGLQVLSIFVNRIADEGKARLQFSHWFAILPFALISAIYFLLIYQAKQTHLHLNDGTFSLSAPFITTLINSATRLMWFWGIAAAVALTLLKKLKPVFLVVVLGWTIITLLPYSFLTYMNRVPSRHTYLASVAAALLVAAAFLAVRDRWPRRPALTAAVALAFVLHNCLYLWTVKQQQYQLRAAPTHDLIRFARTYDGPIYVSCFEYAQEVATLALDMELKSQSHRLRWINPPVCSDHQYHRMPPQPSAVLEQAPASLP
ncbi:MAG TPA: hypothetical protein VEQ63_03100, partial [Bryobacteraceae bacterium]|nr:hypothetical protein [Bryobacteraceae bacterium]